MSPTATASASAIIAETSIGYHHLKIHGYSSLKGLPVGHRLSSCPFTVGGPSLENRLLPQRRPRGERGATSPSTSSSTTTSPRMSRRSSELVSSPTRSAHSSSSTTTRPSHRSPQHLRTASPARGALGYPKFVQLSALENSKILKNDSFTIRCDVVVIDRVRIEGKGSDEKKEAPKFVKVPPSDLNRHLGGLLLAERGADVVFQAGGETFAAHRCVLAARSPVFSAELFGSMKEGNTAHGSVVRVHDMEAQVFKALLCFLYTDSLPEMGKEEEDVMCQHLLVTADKYGMERMKLVCEDRLCKYIHVNTVANILALAQLHSCAGLKSACVHFLTSPGNLRAAMDSDGFHHLTTTCPSLLKELITMSAPN
ncbi:hypothetical protein ACQ4PT_049447 [Festuca glaucescens]